MHAERLAELMLMLMVPIGAGNDLLDCVSTEQYWNTRGIEISVDSMKAELQVGETPDITALIRDLASEDFATRERATRAIRRVGPLAISQLEKAKASNDPEVAYRARMLLRHMGHGQQTKQTRLLMAVRALGELGDQRGLEALERFTSSKQPFVAEYARRSISQIKREPYDPGDRTQDEYDQEIWLMPKSCGAIGQLTARKMIPIRLEKVFERILALVDDPADAEKQRARMAQMRDMMHDLIDRIGNVRVDTLTFAISEKIDHRQGFVVFSLHGRYEKERILAYFEQFGTPRTRVRDIDAFVPDDEVCFLFPSDERFLFIAGPNEEALPIKEIAAALKTGEGSLKENEELAKLIDNVDRAQTAWYAMRMTPQYKEAPVLSALTSITATLRHEDTGLKATINATGDNEATLTAAVAMFDMGLKMAINEIQREVDDMPMLQPIVDMLKSIKHERNDLDVVVTAELEGSSADLLTSLVGAVFGMKHIF
jgi:hypothetical protein